MLVNLEILQEYLDGELSAQARAEVESQVAADPNLAACLNQLRQDQSLRRQVWETYTPTQQQSSQMAANCIAELRDQAYAPLKVSFATPQTLQALRRMALVAACLLIGLGGYVAGRTSAGPAATTAPTAGQSTQYVVRIEMPGGESVSQTFTDYAAAQKFARSYLLDHAASVQNATEQVAALPHQGVF